MCRGIEAGGQAEALLADRGNTALDLAQKLLQQSHLGAVEIGHQLILIGMRHRHDLVIDLAPAIAEIELRAAPVARV